MSNCFGAEFCMRGKLASVPGHASIILAVLCALALFEPLFFGVEINRASQSACSMLNSQSLGLVDKLREAFIWPPELSHSFQSSRI